MLRWHVKQHSASSHPALVVPGPETLGLEKSLRSLPNHLKLHAMDLTGALDDRCASVAVVHGLYVD